MNFVDILFTEHTVQRNLPINIVASDSVFFGKEYKKNIPACYKRTYGNIRVTKEGVLFKNYKLIDQSVYSKRIHMEFGLGYRLKNLLLGRSKSLKRHAYALCFNSWYYGYFHWMSECLPRYYIGSLQSPDDLYFIPQTIENYHYESLLSLGFKAHQLIPIRETLKIRQLSLYERLAPSGNYNESVIRDMASRIKASFKIEDGVLERKIYVSRKKATKRKIINEDQIIGCLETYNYEILCLEDFSFEEQVKLFAETRVFVSIHGAGLTNMMFMRPNTHVVEIRKEEDTSNLCYFSLASACAINYYYLFGQPDDPEKNVQNADLFVAPHQLEEIIRRF